MAQVTYEELVRLEPRLEELEQRIADVRDPGNTEWYCSNYVWMPLNADLKDLVGVARRHTGASSDLRPEEEALLRSSFSYEVAYLHLSALMPPCRACGCREFEPYQQAQVEDVERRR